MYRRGCFVLLFLLLPLVSAQSQVNPPANTPLAETAETEASRLALETVQLYKQGKYKEALPLAKRCLQIREKIFTPADDQLRVALQNLAEVDTALGKYAEAESLFERLIKACEEFAAGDPLFINALQRLGLIKFATGQHGQSEKLFQRALALTEKAYQPDGPKAFDAAGPEVAQPLYEFFIAKVKQELVEVATGSFRSEMQVELVNDGPVTILLDSRKQF